MWHRCSIGLLAASLVSAIAPSAWARSFPDVQNHWAQGCIQHLSDRRILSGYPDGNFRPDRPVTRAEFATVIDAAFATPTRSQSTRNFNDVPPSHWAISAIRATAASGFLVGYPDGRFQPNLSIPRVQVLVSLANGLQYAPSQAADVTLNRAFDDVNEIPDYAKSAIAAATETGLVANPETPRSLHPNRLASRAEVSAFLCRAIAPSTIEPQYVTTVSVPEIRGVWLTNIDSEVLFSRQNLEAAMQRLARLNFNTVYPTVWNWGYTLYPSAVAERVIGRSLDPEPGLQERDLLKEAIAFGKQYNLRVIPWFEFGFMAPADSQLAQRHPEWLTQRRDGTTVKMEGTHPRVWLNPFHPEVQAFILDLIVEIVREYDADGIQFDDHMGLPVEFGYDDYTVALYQQEHNGKSPPADPSDPEWVRWRADKITDFMARVFEAVKRENPDALVALSPNPQHFAYPVFLQDWHTWERRGLVEEIVLQVYRRDRAKFVEELEYAEVQAARRHVPVAIGILAGLKGRPIPSDRMETQVSLAGQRGFAGVSFFFYESLWQWSEETPEARERAIADWFESEVDAPSLQENWQPPQ